MAPKIVKKGPFSFLQRCCGPETTKAIEPSATRPPVAVAAVASPPPPEPAPVPNLLTREPLTVVEDEPESDTIDVDTGVVMNQTVIIPTEEKRVTLSSVILVMTAIALATLLMNVD
jgi:hypothetical protein